MQDVEKQMRSSCAVVLKFFLVFLLTYPVFVVASSDMHFASDPDTPDDTTRCRGIGHSIVASGSARFRVMLEEIGKSHAPSATIVPCEGEHPIHGPAFSVMFVGTDDGSVHAWGVVLSRDILARYTDEELRGLIAHELAHLISGIGNCNHLRGKSNRRCEEKVDEFAAQLVGACPVLKMLYVTEGDLTRVPGEFSHGVIDAIRARIERMRGRCALRVSVV